MRLIVVRHGETVYNRQGRYSGQADIALSMLGELQAEVLGLRLAEEQLDVIVSSDLGRARSTAMAIARHHSLPVEEDADLREIAFGAWEGATHEEVVARDPVLVERWLADPTLTAPPGGETGEEQHARVVRALERWRGRYPQSTVLWAVHGGVIEVLLCHVLKVSLSRRWEFCHANAELTEILVGEQGAVVARLKDPLFLG